jgi:1,2-diacylglycerol 3-alpha-glucosyltransferase
MKSSYIHIAIFTDTYRPSINGITTSIDHLSLRMAERGHRISIISPTINDSLTSLHSNITLIHVPSVPASYYDDFRWSSLRTSKLLERLRKAEIDIVHFMTPIATSYVGIKIARKLGIPVVGTYHTLIADPTYYEQMLKHFIRATPESVWYYTNLYYNAADLVTAPTQNMVDLLEEHDCTTEKLAISNGIDPSIFNNDKKNDIKQRYKLGDKTILYVGRVSIEKNINILIDAFDAAALECPDAQLLIVGDGPKRHEIEKYASKKSSSGRIQFTGMIPHEELVKSGIYGACRLFATASETETQGITLLEALHNGLPCIGADSLGVSETIEHEKTGLLVKPGSVDDMALAMVELLKDDEKLDLMSKNAKEWVKPHYIDAIIKRWESLYLDLIEKSKANELPVKDYLHVNQILSTLRRFKISNPFIKV